MFYVWGGDGLSGVEWLMVDPFFVSTVGFLGLFNYLFDQQFRMALYLYPCLSLLYVFQFHLFLPLVNFVSVATLFKLRERFPSLSAGTSLYQYHLMLPLANVALLYPLLFGGVRSLWGRVSTRNTVAVHCGEMGGGRCRWTRRSVLPLLFSALVVFSLVSAPVLARPRSGSSGESNVASGLLVTKTEDFVSIWPGAFGRVEYLVEGSKFVGVVTAQGLKPETRYVLTINGQGGTSTDDLIYSAAEGDVEYPSLFDGWWKGRDEVLGTGDDEGYYDFANVTTTGGGTLKYNFSVALPSGSYLWVKFLVKDTTVGWQTVLMEDAALCFTVK